MKTKSLLREKVWFPNIDKLVESKVKSCRACLITTSECKREPLEMSPLPAAPWKGISVDFANLPNQEYLLLITDDYSRYQVVDIVKSTSAATVIPKLDIMFSEFGVPDVVKSDNGPPFNSKEFASFPDDLGFKHRKVTPKWARANEEVERFLRTVKKVIKTAKLEHKNPKQELNRLLRNYRATPHSTTRVAPATALFGRPMKTKIPELTNATPCSDPEIQERDRSAKAKMKKHADSKRYVKPSTVKEGDTVFVKRNDSKKKSDTPYDPRTHIVVEKKGSMVTAQGTLRSSRVSLWQQQKTPVQRPARILLMLQPHLIPQIHRCSPKPHRRDTTRCVCKHAQLSWTTMFVADSDPHVNCYRLC